MIVSRFPGNPIVAPGGKGFRRAATFNPGVLRFKGRYLMYERAAASLKPFQTSIGLLESEDGIDFRPVGEGPVFSAAMIGYPMGSVEDARVVEIGGLIYMVYALQPYAFDCWPNGVSVPEYFPEHYPEWELAGVPPMMTRSGIAVSEDGRTFRQLGFITPEDIDDRDCSLFPERIGGKFVLLRRPMQYVGEGYGTDRPGIWISESADLREWEEPRLLAVSERPWEGLKIGTAATPLRTDSGWILLYHGVDEDSRYRVGALLLDLERPGLVLGRTPEPIMGPEAYYEKFGLVIPNVIFPTANIMREGSIHLYYGCCDTCISLATIELDDLLAEIRPTKAAPR
jgi:beta-1,2-mannobiose phosphorylase / 1,2-beta-oligomannan phosphorylase